MANRPIFRVEAYRLADAEFTGTGYRIDLRHELSRNYFAMVYFGCDDLSSVASDNVGVYVTADPYGTGDLGISGGNWLFLERADSDEGDAVGVVYVVECLRSSTTAGFRLRSVETTTLPDFASTGEQVVSDTSATAWTDIDQVVLFGGFGGGGAYTIAGVSSADLRSLGIRCYPSGTDTINIVRYANGATDVEEALVTIYVVEWGSEWTVQRAVVTGTAGSPLMNDVAHYDGTAISAANRATSWIWACGYADGTGSGSAFTGIVAALGDGVTQLASESEVSVGIATGVLHSTDVYVMTHASLAVDSVFHASADGSEASLAITVDAAVGDEEYLAADSLYNASTYGSRIASVWGTMNSSATTTLTQGLFSARPTGSTTVTVYRADPVPALDWAGWVQVADFAAIVDTATATDVENGGPAQYLVLQDPWWEGVALSATSEAGRYVGPLTPDADNRGSLYGFQDGVPSASTEIDYQIVRGGGVGGRAGYVRKLSTEASTRWCGTNAWTTFFRHVSPVEDEHYAGTCCFSSVYNRVLVFQAQSDTTIRIYYRDLGDNPRGMTAWTETSLTVVNADYGSGSGSLADTGMDVVELPDGSLFLVHQTYKSAAASYDADAYISEDGGLTWTLVHRNLRGLVEGTGGFVSGKSGWRMAVSGDWIRLVRFSSSVDQSNPVSNSLTSWVSSDRGASWTKLVNTVNIVPRGGATIDCNAGYWAYAMVGMGDQSGTFLLTVQDGTSGEKTYAYIASGMDEWTEYSALRLDWSSLALGRTDAQWLVRDPDRIWLITQGSNSTGTTAGIFTYWIDPKDPTDPDNWEAHLTSTATLDGRPQQVPWNTKGVWCGDHFLLYGAVARHATTSGDNIWFGCYLLAAGQWDTQPWNYVTDSADTVNNPTTWLDVTRTMSTAWWAAMGEPHNAGGSAWTRTGSSFTVTADYIQASSTSGNTGYYEYNEGGPGSSDRWDRNTFGFYFYVSAVRTGSDPTSNEDMGLKIVGYSPSSAAVDCTLRIGTTTAVLRDNVAGSNKVTISGLSSSTWYEWRVCVDGADIHIKYRSVSGAPSADADWTTVAVQTVSRTTTAAQLVRLGVLNGYVGAGSSTCRMSELVISYRSPVGQNHADLTFPGCLAGMPIARGRIHTANGVYARWGGSGAFQGDLFTGEINHSRGVENLGLDSPRFMWESTSLVENAIVFRAGESADFSRWQMNAITLVGTVDRTARLQMNATDSWSSPSVDVDLSADLFVDLVVLAVADGSAFQLGSSVGDPLPDLGEARGLFIRFTAASTATGETFEIKADQDRGNGWFQVDGGADLDDVGIVIGTGAVIFGDRMVYRSATFLKYKFFRIVFPDVSTVTNTRGTATGTHRLGSIVPGFWLGFEVPLEWSFTDNEQPNITEQQSKSAVTWAHSEGPNQRTISGRVVGDSDEFRMKLRRVLGKYHDYSRRPAMLVLDAERAPHSDVVIYGRWRGGSQKDEAAWYPDDNDVWRTAGDVDLVFTEVP